MGLDVSAVKVDYVDAGEFKNIGVVLKGGGAYEEGYCASFCGKTYSDLVYDITGEGLYHELISPIILDIMAEEMQKHLKENYPKSRDADPVKDYPDITVGELRALTNFFLHCVKNNYCLHSWW